MLTCLACGAEVKTVSWTHLKKCSNISIGEYKKRFPDAILVTEETKRKQVKTLENFIKKYGEREGNERWNVYVEKQRYSNTLEYKKKTHGWTEEEFNEYNQSRSVTKNNLIKRHGIVEGKKKWDAYVERQRHAGCSEEYFMEKLGEGEGKQFYKELCKKKGRPYEYFLNKADGNHSLALKMLEKDRSKTYHKVSNASKEFFSLLTQEFIIPEEHIRYEFGKLHPETHKYYFYDFVDIEKKLCIEYNGDLFHANPAQYKPSDIPKFRGNKRTAIDLWEYDQKKRDLLCSMGFTVIVVWEYDHRNNIEDVLSKFEEYYERTTDI